MYKKNNRDLIGLNKLLKSQVNLETECQSTKISIKVKKPEIIPFHNSDTKRNRERIGANLLRKITSESLNSQHRRYQKEDYLSLSCNQINKFGKEIAKMTK